MASSRNNRKRSKKEKKKSHTKEDKIIADAKSALESSSSSDSEDDDEGLFSVEKIMDSKIDKNGVQLYKCRWKGYTAADDTWEPTENVSSTGHVDRYERLQWQKTLKAGTPGVALIEYEDGERELVDLKVEKFRGHRDVSDDERDDDSVDGDDDVNNFDLVIKGKWIEILWRRANMYFSCKIISYTPIKSKKKSKKRARMKEKVNAEVMKGESAKETKPASKKRKTETTKQPLPSSQKKKEENMIAAHAKQSQPNTPEPEELTEETENVSDDLSSDDDGYASPRIVKRAGHGIPLFDEPEDDFSDDDDESEDEGEDDEDREESLNAYRCSPKIDNLNHAYKRNVNVQKLTFEEQWTLKLKQTQEMIDRESLDNSHQTIASLMARQL